MKVLLYLISLQVIFLPVVLGQQNHVPNGNFENVQACPTNHSQVSRCVGWRQYTTGTSDYYHSCASFVGVPSNNNGFQYAASGQGYMGGIQYTSYSTNSDKEYIACEITPLTPGRAYRVSMSLSLSNNSRYGCNDMGVFFYDSNAYTVNTWNVLNVTPQVSYTNYGPIMDTANWVRVSQIFVADSAYDNIVIGGFLAYNQLQVDSFMTSGEAYYYIDSVVIVPVDTFEHMTLLDTVFCTEDTFSVEYNTLIRYNSNNQYKVQLSDKNGGFSSGTSIIGTVNSDTAGWIHCTIPNTIPNGTGYRIRVLSTSPADTTSESVQTLNIANPDSTTYNVSNSGPVCDLAGVTFTGSCNVTPNTFSWTGPSSFSSSNQSPYLGAASMAHNGYYIATIKFNGCEVTDTTHLVVNPLPSVPVVTNNTPFCSGDTLKLSAYSTTSGVTYQWYGPQSFNTTTQNPVIANTTTANGGLYSVVVKSGNGCLRTGTTTATIKPYPNAFTLSNTGPVCEDDSITFTLNPGTTGATYSWSGPQGFSASTKDAGRNNTVPVYSGWYYVDVDLNGCVSHDSVNATINPRATEPNLTSGGKICAGETLVINASNAGTGATYSWAGPTGFTSNSQNVARTNIQVQDTGLYTVTAVIGNCAATPVSVRISNINPTPFVVIQTSPGDTLCQGDAVVMSALPNNFGGTPQFTWFVNTQVVGTGSVYTSNTFNNGDVIKCEMDEFTMCSAQHTDESNLVKLSVLPWLSPKVSIIATPSTPVKEGDYVKFTALVTDAGPQPVYQWKRNGKAEIGATGSTWSANTLSDNDDVWVEVTSTYRCPQPQTVISNNVKVKVLTSVGELSDGNPLQLFPNPNNGSFIVKAVLDERKVTISVVNSIGAVLYKEQKELLSGVLDTEITLTDMPAGVYSLLITGETRSYKYRFVVQQ